MSTPIIRPGIEELRERTQRLERAADRRRLVLAFGIKAADGTLEVMRRSGLSKPVVWPNAASQSLSLRKGLRMADSLRAMSARPALPAARWIAKSVLADIASYPGDLAGEAAVRGFVIFRQPALQ